MELENPGKINKNYVSVPSLQIENPGRERNAQYFSAKEQTTTLFC
jgi:hypothetical protein